MGSGSGSGSGSSLDWGWGIGVGVFCLTEGLDGPARALVFFAPEERAFDSDKAASVADISTISESSSDKTTSFLPLRAGGFLDLSGGTTTLEGSGLSGAEDLVDLRVGTSSTSSSSSLTTTEALVLPVSVEVLGFAVGRPLRGGGSC